MDAHKPRRTLEKGFKNQVRTVFEELNSCDIDANVVHFCVGLALGRKISDVDLKVKNAVHQIPKQGANRDLFDENTCIDITSIANLKLEYSHNHVEYKSYSNDKKGPFYFYEPNAYDWRIPPDKQIESLIRTILPTPSENIFVGSKKFTPVSIIITSGRPKVSPSNDEEKEFGAFKCSSKWNHYIINPSKLGMNEPPELQENLAERIYILFKTLGLASPKMGRSVDKKIFKEIITKHPILRNVIDMSVNPDNSFHLVPTKPFENRNTNFLHINKYNETKQTLKLNFSSLRIDKPDRNNTGASLIDIDALSSGLSHLTTLTDATVITFYVESDYDKSGKLIEQLVRPYIIASDTIIDMFLDFREFGPRYQHSYAFNMHGVAIFNKSTASDRGSIDSTKFKEIVRQRDSFFYNYYAQESLIQKSPNLLSAKINRCLNRTKNKITDFRTTLAFSFCWNNEKPCFDRLGFKPNPDLSINSPTPYRFEIDV